MSLQIDQKVSANLFSMSEDHLDQVVALEKTAYSHPWTPGNFRDALSAGYWARVLMQGSELIGHVVAMRGVEETHLLNLTVAQDHQGRGWGRHMLDAWVSWSRTEGARQLWLEVRASNARAMSVYKRFGFRRIGERKRYYPLSAEQREDAIVMSLMLGTAQQTAHGSHP